MGDTINNSNTPIPTGISFGSRVKEYATYADMIADKNPRKYARVADASADETVGSGSAIYRRTGETWTKVYEEESMDQEGDGHTHSNKNILDKLGENNNSLTYNNEPISGSISNGVLYANTMPTVSASNLGSVVLYTGTTDQNYTKGHIYICDVVNGIYAWIDITGITELEQEINSYESDALAILGTTSDFETAANAIIGE